MIKKIIIGFILMFFYFFQFNNVYWESLADKYKNNKGVVNIRLELKLEDENKNTLPLQLKVVWKNEIKNKTYKVRYFNEINKWFVSMESRLKKNEFHWYLYLYDNAKKWKNKTTGLKRTIKIPLDYNFEGSSSTKIQLYYIQLENKWKWYELKRIYTKYDLEKEEKIEEEKEIEIKGIIDTYYFKRWIKVWLYNDKGIEIYYDYTNIDWEFFINLENYKEKIKTNKDYYLIWWKDWNIELNEYWFLWEWRKFKFDSYKDLRNTFWSPIDIKANLNDKDKAVSEDFPYIFLLIFIIIYLIIIYFIFIKIIKKIFIQTLKRKQNIVFSERKDKIIKLKERLW